MVHLRVIQDAMTDRGFDREKIVSYLQSLNDEEFNEFCQAVLHLEHFYTSNVGSHRTDDTALISQFPEKFWKTTAIDPKSPFGALPQE